MYYYKMTNIRVNIFNGINLQIPRSFDVTADTYQNIVSNLINVGEKSGDIYYINGQKLDYNNYNTEITTPEIQYITFPSEIIEDGLSIRDYQNNRLFYIPYSSTMKIHDVYNYIVAADPTYCNNIILYHNGYQLDYNNSVIDYQNINRSPIDIYYQNY